MFVALGLLIACGTPEPPPDPGMPVEQIARYVGAEATDREGWADDIRAGLQAAGKPVDEHHVCAVVAIIEQESSYEADPAVPNLGAIEQGLAILGPLADRGVDWLLKPIPDGQEISFDARLAKVRTEQQLDRFYRDLATHYTGAAAKLPGATSLLESQFEQLNPVTTAGSMQVSVAWAQDFAKSNGVPARTVRDLLYTRAGGLRWGTARLFAYDAGYDDIKYRFADFNAGEFASRNAAFQEQLGEVMELSLAPDGDLLAYKKNGKAEDGETMGALLAWRAMHAPDLTERQVRRDVGLEKEQRFEKTETWSRVRDTFREQTSKEPEYARMPDVALTSPKMSKPRSTAWFAKNVKRRYDNCLERDGDG